MGKLILHKNGAYADLDRSLWLPVNRRQPFQVRSLAVDIRVGVPHQRIQRAHRLEHSLGAVACRPATIDPALAVWRLFETGASERESRVRGAKGKAQDAG